MKNHTTILQPIVINNNCDICGTKYKNTFNDGNVIHGIFVKFEKLSIPCPECGHFNPKGKINVKNVISYW